MKVCNLFGVVTDLRADVKMTVSLRQIPGEAFIVSSVQVTK
jgi:hypothetical protein